MAYDNNLFPFEPLAQVFDDFDRISIEILKSGILGVIFRISATCLAGTALIPVHHNEIVLPTRGLGVCKGHAHCGWGRTGSSFATVEFDVMPDMMISAKGLTNGAMPMSAVFVSSRIYNTCMEQAKDAVEFFHGYTYSCHPVCCAAGMATLDIYEKEGLLSRAKTDGEIGTYWQDALHHLADLPQVIDVRNYGLLGAVELRAPKGKNGTIGAKALTTCWDKGVMVRGIGDAIFMSPPLIIEKQEIDSIVSVLRDIIPGITA